MSGLAKVPVGRRCAIALCVAVAVGCTLIAGIALWSHEDHRTTYDKQGHYLPGFCLKELAGAMHAYHRDHGHLPPAATYGPDGLPLLSWRVLLLPYIEQEVLFRRFKLDEPWDSPHNLRLRSQMPYTYGPLEGEPPLPPYTTPFQVFVGKGTAFAGREGLRLKEDLPRSSSTILIVEAGQAVAWTKPEDIPYEANRPLPKLGCFFRGLFHVAMAAGHAMAVPQGISESRLRAAILRNGDGPALWDDF
jgi:hypothetical protein